MPIKCLIFIYVLLEFSFCTDSQTSCYSVEKYFSSASPACTFLLFLELDLLIFTNRMEL